MKVNTIVKKDEYQRLIKIGSAWYVQYSPVEDSEDSEWYKVYRSFVCFGNEPSEEQYLAVAKADLMESVDAYSDSDAVNGFKIKDNSYVKENEEDPEVKYNIFWVNVNDRIKLAQETIPTAESIGISELSLPLGGVILTMTVAMAKAAINGIQQYAVACYEVTNAKKSAIINASSMEEIDSIREDIGYPAMLEFEF